MSKRMEGPCVIPGCPGAGIRGGVTLVECDNPACGFSATVEHWVALASVLPLRSGHPPRSSEVWIVAFEDDLDIAYISDDEEYAEERADKLPMGACVHGPYKVTGVAGRTTIGERNKETYKRPDPWIGWKKGQ
jgi:hypothetical protein